MKEREILTSSKTEQIFGTCLEIKLDLFQNMSPTEEGTTQSNHSY